MADNINYFSNDEESAWLANIDPNLLDKSNEEKQLDIDDSEIPIPFRFANVCHGFPVNKYPRNSPART